MGFLFSSLATFSAPLNWPEVSAIEIFMDFTREIETYPFPSIANAEMHSHKPGVLGTLPLPLPLSSSAGTDALILFTKYTKEERREWLDRKVPLESGFAHGSNGCEKRNVLRRTSLFGRVI